MEGAGRVVVRGVHTRDRRWRLLIHHDQSAELIDERGNIVLCRVPMYQIGERLAELGVSSDDLVPDEAR